MAWCRQATSHYLNQCWPRSLPLYNVTRPQWVNSMGECKKNVSNGVTSFFHQPIVMSMLVQVMACCHKASQGHNELSNGFTSCLHWTINISSQNNCYTCLYSCSCHFTQKKIGILCHISSSESSYLLICLFIYLFNSLTQIIVTLTVGLFQSFGCIFIKRQSWYWSSNCIQPLYF